MIQNFSEIVRKCFEIYNLDKNMNIFKLELRKVFNKLSKKYKINKSFDEVIDLVRYFTDDEIRLYKLEAGTVSSDRFPEKYNICLSMFYIRSKYLKDHRGYKSFEDYLKDTADHEMCHVFADIIDHNHSNDNNGHCKTFIDMYEPLRSRYTNIKFNPDTCNFSVNKYWARKFIDTSYEGKMRSISSYKKGDWYILLADYFGSKGCLLVVPRVMTRAFMVDDYYGEKALFISFDWMNKLINSGNEDYLNSVIHYGDEDLDLTADELLDMYNNRN